MCNGWSHKQCTKLSDSDFRVMSKPHILWICLECSPNVMAGNRLKTIEEKIDIFQGEISKIIDKQRNFEHSIIDFDKKLTNFQSRFVILEDSVKNVNSNNLFRLVEVEKLLASTNERFIRLETSYAAVNGNARTDVTDALPCTIDTLQIKKICKEREEEKIRELNIILFGVSESSAGDKHGDDLEFLKDLALFLGVDINFNKLSFSRFGRVNETNPRPIRLSFEDVRDKWSFYRTYPLLKNGPAKFRRLGISLDRSKEERILYNQLKADLKTRKANHENVVLYRDKIINKNFFDKKNISLEQNSGDISDDK